MRQIEDKFGYEDRRRFWTRRERLEEKLYNLLRREREEEG